MRSALQPSDENDSDEYGSFDEEELELLNDILEVHSPPQGQASGNALPPSHPVSPKPLLNIPSQQIFYPSLEPSAKPVTLPYFELSEGQSDDPEAEPEDDVEASEHGFQMPISRHLGSQMATRDDVLEIQYESTAPPSTTGTPSSNPPAPMPAPLHTDESPFNRFRGFKRGLSVTDLLSNTWCEQQFEYYLVRGKKRTTPAMRAGTKIHRKLEREVHETVPVDVESPEDRFGLKILNMIQGLRTLRETGMTREFPAFALVRGMFVQGVIDEISYTKPIEKVYSVQDEESSSPSDGDGSVKLPKKRGRKKKDETNSNSVKKQRSLMSDFLTPALTRGTLNVSYISDCKTRLRDSLPTASQFRGAELQLMLYHFLLTTMASSVQSAAEMYKRSEDSSASTNGSAAVTGEDLFSRLFAAQKLDPYANFTDGFLAQMASLLDESDPEMEPDSIHSTTSPGIMRFPTLTHIMDNPTLSGVVCLLDTSFTMAIPSLGNTLAVSYRSQQSSRLLATKTVEYNQMRMKEHLDQVLQWWQGQRATVGVPIEEAWKCRSCDFADECEWRLQKIEELKLEKKEKEIKSTKEKEGAAIVG